MTDNIIDWGTCDRIDDPYYGILNNWSEIVSLTDATTSGIRLLFRTGDRWEQRTLIRTAGEQPSRIEKKSVPSRPLPVTEASGRIQICNKTIAYLDPNYPNDSAFPNPCQQIVDQILCSRARELFAPIRKANAVATNWWSDFLGTAYYHGMMSDCLQGILPRASNAADADKQYLLMFGDGNNFKKLNDESHSKHVLGDACAAALGIAIHNGLVDATLNQTLERGCVVRIGGDEFAIFAIAPTGDPQSILHAVASHIDHTLADQVTRLTDSFTDHQDRKLLSTLSISLAAKVIDGAEYAAAMDDLTDKYSDPTADDLWDSIHLGFEYGVRLAKAIKDNDSSTSLEKRRLLLTILDKNLDQLRAQQDVLMRGLEQVRMQMTACAKQQSEYISLPRIAVKSTDGTSKDIMLLRHKRTPIHGTIEVSSGAGTASRPVEYVRYDAREDTYIARTDEQPPCECPVILPHTSNH